MRTSVRLGAAPGRTPRRSRLAGLRNLAATALQLGTVVPLVGCSLGQAAGGVLQEALLPAASVDVPFDAAQRGAVAEVTFHVSRRYLSSFTLNYYFHGTDKASWERFRELVTGFDYHNPGYKQLHESLSIPVKLQVGRKGETHPWSVLNIISTRQIMESSAHSEVSIQITADVLPPGDYRARIEALEDTPALRSLEVRFGVHGRGQ